MSEYSSIYSSDYASCQEDQTSTGVISGYCGPTIGEAQSTTCFPDGQETESSSGASPSPSDCRTCSTDYRSARSTPDSERLELDRVWRAHGPIVAPLQSSYLRWNWRNGLHRPVERYAADNRIVGVLRRDAGEPTYVDMNPIYIESGEESTQSHQEEQDSESFYSIVTEDTSERSVRGGEGSDEASYRTASTSLSFYGSPASTSGVSSQCSTPAPEVTRADTTTLEMEPAGGNTESPCQEGGTGPDSSTSPTTGVDRQASRDRSPLRTASVINSNMRTWRRLAPAGRSREDSSPPRVGPRRYSSSSDPEADQEPRLLVVQAQVHAAPTTPPEPAVRAPGDGQGQDHRADQRAGDAEQRRLLRERIDRAMRGTTGTRKTIREWKAIIDQTTSGMSHNELSLVVSAEDLDQLGTLPRRASSGRDRPPIPASAATMPSLRLCGTITSTQSSPTCERSARGPPSRQSAEARRRQMEELRLAQMWQGYPAHSSRMRAYSASGGMRSYETPSAAASPMQGRSTTPDPRGSMETLARTVPSTSLQASTAARSRRVILLDRPSFSAASGRAFSAPGTVPLVSHRVRSEWGGVSSDGTYIRASGFRMQPCGETAGFSCPAVGEYQEPDWIVRQPAHASHQLTASRSQAEAALLGKPRVRQPGPPTPPTTRRVGLRTLAPAPARQPGPQASPPSRQPAQPTSSPRESGVLMTAPRARSASPPTPPPRPRSPSSTFLPGQLREMSELSQRVWPLLSKNGGSDVPRMGGRSRASPEARVMDSPRLINSAPGAKSLSPRLPELGLTINCPASCHPSVAATVTLAIALAVAVSYVVYDLYQSKWYMYVEQ